MIYTKFENHVKPIKCIKEKEYIMLPKLEIKGVIPAIVTPFDRKTEDFNEERFRALLQYQLSKGITGVVPCGSTGEFVNMTFKERKKVIEVTVDEVGGKIPVIAGTGETGTRLVLDATKHAQDVGADAAIIITPYYLKPGAKGLYEHYAEIIEKTDIPIVLYNFPQVTGLSMPWTVVEDLVDEFDQIVAMKDSSGDMKYFMSVLEKVTPKINLLIGWDENVLPALVAGASGMILASVNVIPEIWLEIYNNVKNGDIDSAVNKQREIQKFLRMIVASGAIGCKACLNFMGIKAGVARKPIVVGDALSWEFKDELRVELEKFKLIETKILKFEIGKKSVEQRFAAVDITPEIIENFTLLTGEALVGSENEVAHIDLLVGLKDGPVGKAYADALSRVDDKQKEALQVILEPNVQVIPRTIMIPTVTPKSMRHASLVYGAAQAAVAKAIVQSIEDGILPRSDDIVMISNVFVHPAASRRKRVYINNYKAMRHAIRKAMENRTTLEENLENKRNARHPFQNDP
ncbi:MAG: 4-hydroxy-tetrahydrodipicolinate synthase [Candidatus Hodarchaeales archaeon]|jgi:4-hydroxy-tetrahydrodipicolinate synthase